MSIRKIDKYESGHFCLVWSWNLIRIHQSEMYFGDTLLHSLRNHYVKMWTLLLGKRIVMEKVQIHARGSSNMKTKCGIHEYMRNEKHIIFAHLNFICNYMKEIEFYMYLRNENGWKTPLVDLLKLAPCQWGSSLTLTAQLMINYSMIGP